MRRMALHRRIGIITILIGVFLGLLGMVLSTNVCTGDSGAYDRWYTWLLVCNEIRFYDTSNPFNRFDADAIYFNAVWVVYGALVLIALGGLWLFGVLPAPLEERKATLP
jgi:hypothetical protein